MNFKQHESCEGCLAYLPDHPDLPVCFLGYPIAFIEPEEPCFKPLTERHFTILKTLQRSRYGQSRQGSSV